MPFRIHYWNEISHNYRGTLLLGNGASRAVDERFDYASLVEHAFEHRLLTEDVKSLFRFFRTKDFELKKVSVIA
ncbi:DUF4917 family protein [Nitrosomonas sp. Is37]|uniref:DUF4917 family protein n=1 Tax=Nitrosomonas sp. Is37 TaxID=3080535 RepID=UPI00398259B1